MNKFTFLIAVMMLPFFVYAQKNNDDGLQEIIGGTEAPAEEFPWMTGVVIPLFLDDSTFCGGSLIAPQWVLTAAHCVDFVENVNLVINSLVLDAQNLEPYSEYLPSDTIFIHEDYGDYGPDIALIRLAMPSLIEPIDLASYEDQSLFEHAMPGKVLGWGRTESGDPSETLLLADVSFFHPDTCKTLYEETTNEFNFYEMNEGGNICAGYFPGQAMQGAACGDSGGPLFIEDNGIYKQVGVVSGGDTLLTTAEFPGVYTLIPEYRNWIDSVIISNSVVTSTAELSPVNSTLTARYAQGKIELAGLRPNTKYHLSIQSVSGQMIKFENFNSNNSFHQVPINNIPIGLYFIGIRHLENGFLESTKVFISR